MSERMDATPRSVDDWAVESFHRVLHNAPGAGMHDEGEISHGCEGSWIDDYGWQAIPRALVAAGWTPPRDDGATMDDSQ